ncbi:class I tRNA ligase family protein [Desulfobacter vibrioformis]|uniref:class I tRNA ligase family protein n=1 Tax=Desulfobacter vibrioformis TaxID=34031 RepID=UPI0005541F1E|nr:class I tRNA ligase family protein [Desulfobacter vibrioformis]
MPPPIIFQPFFAFIPSLCEEEILNFWKENGIFEKSLEKNQRQTALYFFYDGPLFATGMPHYGHILTSYIKDTIPRFFTMQGRFVDRRWGGIAMACPRY